MCPKSCASSTGRCNTIQYVDSTMFARENHLFGCTRPKSCRGSVPAGLTLASDFSFCFQCEVGSSSVLRRPIETACDCGKRIPRKLDAWNELLEARVSVGFLGRSASPTT